MNPGHVKHLILVVLVAGLLLGCLSPPSNTPPSNRPASNTTPRGIGDVAPESFDGSEVKQCLAETDLPATLGILNDDAMWLCGADRPEKPHEYGIGIVAAGIEECYPGDEPEAPGNDIWVATDGDDGHNGMDETQALRTLKSALCRVRPGQTIHLGPGTYHTAVAVGGMGHSHSAPVVIRGEGDDPSSVVLDGEYWRSFALGLVESFNFRIENLTVQHYTDAGIYSLVGGGVSIQNVISRFNGRCSVDPDAQGEGFGVNLDGTGDIRVENSRFEHNGPLLAPALCGEALGTGINTFEASGVIRGNTIVHTRGGGILVEKSTGPFLIENNLAEKNDFLAPNNYWDAGIWIDESVDVTLRNNRFRDNWGGAGVMVSDEEGAYPRSSKQITLTHNTLTGNFVGVLVWGYGQCPPPADVIPNWPTLTQDNDLSANRFDDSEHAVWCDPDFVGGQIPQMLGDPHSILLPLVGRSPD